MKKISGSVDAYIRDFEQPVRGLLEQMRYIIRKAAPNSEEVISYQMPTYRQHKSLVHFAGYKNHIGFYPGASGVAAFKKELSVYPGAKGSVQFPLDKPLPEKLITKIVKYRVKEDAAEVTGSQQKKPARPATKTSRDDNAVESWLAKQEKKVREDINLVRQMIKKAAPQINERIRWNAPSYHLDKDLFTFGPFKRRMMLVFHHPAIVKIKSPLLEGNYKDRRLLYFEDRADARQKEKELQKIIRELVKLSIKK